MNEGYWTDIDEALSILENHTQYYVPESDFWAFNMALSALRSMQESKEPGGRQQSND